MEVGCANSRTDRKKKGEKLPKEGVGVEVVNTKGKQQPRRSGKKQAIRYHT